VTRAVAPALPRLIDTQRTRPGPIVTLRCARFDAAFLNASPLCVYKCDNLRVGGGDARPATAAHAKLSPFLYCPYRSMRPRHALASLPPCPGPPPPSLPCPLRDNFHTKPAPRPHPPLPVIVLLRPLPPQLTLATASAATAALPPLRRHRRLRPACGVCSCAEVTSAGAAQPGPQERDEGWAGAVETYRCTRCAAVTRFARLNNPAALLDSRR
jgi:hypothetical protein